jgi:hypothetical protein
MRDSNAHLTVETLETRDTPSAVSAEGFGLLSPPLDAQLARVGGLFTASMQAQGSEVSGAHLTAQIDGILANLDKGQTYGVSIKGADYTLFWVSIGPGGLPSGGTGTSGMWDLAQGKGA